MRIQVCCAKRTVRRRFQTHRVGHLRALQRRCGDVRGATVDGLPVDERVAICHRHGIHVVRVHEIKVVNVGVENVAVANKGVAHIDPLKEFVAAVEPREKRLTKSQWEPADTESEPASEKAHEGRPKNRGTKNRARAPSPPAANERPAAVVERRKAPR